jgi:DNA polymerase I
MLPKFVTRPDPSIYRGNNYVVIDFETTSLDKGTALRGDNRIVLACWHVVRGSETEVSSHFGGEYELERLVEACQRSDFIVAHNAKFELQWLERCGLDLGETLVYDTMLAEYVLGGNRYRAGQLGLNSIAGRRGLGHKNDTVTKLIKAGVCPSEIPRAWLLKYCHQDVRLTHDLFLLQREELAEHGLLPVLYTRCLLTPVLADIEKNGMYLDAERVRKSYERAEADLFELNVKLHTLTGGINTNSGPQLAKFLYEDLKFKELTDHRGKVLRTPAGRPKTDTDTISELRASNKKQREFLEVYSRHREVSNELTKYLRKWQECCENDNGHLTAYFNQHMTQTHRLSSSGSKYKTQFQNFPRAYKPFFSAPEEGWVVGEADGAQLEFRIAVHLGRDERGLRDIESGEDVHAFTSQTLTEAGEPTDRQTAKAHTFKPLYGGQSGTPAQVVYYQAFRDKYKGIAETQQRWINEVLETGKLVTEWGLIYHWPGTKMSRSGYVENTTSICNYPVQGFATAEIIPIAVTFMWHWLRHSDLRMRIVNTIHDSIICLLPEGETQAFHELAQQCLINDVYDYLDRAYGVKLTVPLGCGVKVAKHWGEGKEAKYEAPRELYRENVV